jgi:hypothetical protein
VQLSLVLRLLLLWQRLLPAALLESNVDAERLLPQQPLALRPQHQLLLLELLQAAADAAAAEAAGPGSAEAAGAAASGPAAAAALLAPLRLLVGSQHAAVRAAARRWLLQRLLATGAFSGNGEEPVLWLDLLPRCPSNFRCCRRRCCICLHPANGCQQHAQPLAGSCLPDSLRACVPPAELTAAARQ